MFDNAKFTFFYLLRLVLIFGILIFVVTFVKLTFEAIENYHSPIWFRENKFTWIASAVVAAFFYFLLKLVARIYPIEKEVDMKKRRDDHFRDKWWKP